MAQVKEEEEATNDTWRKVETVSAEEEHTLVLVLLVPSAFLLRGLHTLKHSR